MASPDTLALREEMAGLRQRRTVTPPPMHEGQLRAQPSVEFGRLAVARHLRRKREIAVANQDRAIPVGGPGRRRAKANRNKAAVEHTEAGRRQWRTVAPSGSWTRTRGRQYEGDQIEPGGLLDWAVQRQATA